MFIMKEKFISFFIFCLSLFSSSLAEQTNIYKLVGNPDIHKVAQYSETHIVDDCDSDSIKKKAHYYSQHLKRQQQDTDRQLSWMAGCVKDYKEGLPIYDTSCVLALKESEEEQRERVGNSVDKASQALLPAILLFKSIGGL